MVVIDSKHEIAGKNILTPEDLKRLPFISYLRQTSMRSLVESYFAAAGVEPNVTMELENIEAIKSLVRAGLGAAVLPRCSVAGAADGAGPKTLRIKGIPMSRELCLAMPKSDMIPMAIRKLAVRIIKGLPNSQRATVPKANRRDRSSLCNKSIGAMRIQALPFARKKNLPPW